MQEMGIMQTMHFSCDLSHRLVDGWPGARPRGHRDLLV